ncbi:MULTISPECIES: hypothetical protein [unclassified Streptomyces]|uniref:hypothetical protein n=1 Tax=unclassified Streptomyces TaxID=2593676 RepID=UPI002E800168|nr:hypothetical protein [Streptomyces sp. NBC_00589]WTI35357.1 hypothetical protein OIC96_10345 [Streptomyces sp. NBC_00775]WUB30969.1 hypothetical protein OHA51_39385 [Streptomyces sp. NBC_00589]
MASNGANGEHMLGAARSVLSASRYLRDALEQGQGAVGYAVQELEAAALEAMGQTGSGGVRHFEAGEELAMGRPEGLDDSVTAAFCQLSLAGSLFAASEAVGEGGGSPDPTALDHSIGELQAVTLVLERATGSDPSLALGVEDATAVSADAETAAARVRREAAATLNVIAERAAGVVGDVVAELSRNRVPVAEWLDGLGRTLRLQEAGGTLLRLALRAVERALAALSRLVSGEVLERVREDTAGLLERLATGTAPGAVVVSGLLGFQGVERDIDSCLAGTGLDRDRLDGAAASLLDLTRRYDRTADMLAGAAAALVGVVGWLLGLAGGAVHLPMVLGGGGVLILAGAFVLAADYSDAWNLPSGVTGVRSIVRGAVR